MLLAKETFPYKPLTDSDTLSVLASCGGRPLNNPEYFREFLATSGFPAIGAERSYFIGSLARRSVRALDMSARESVQAFNKGALFYGGVLQTVSGAQQIPFDDEVLTEVHYADDQAFAIESIQRVREEVPSFCELLKEARPAMGTGADDRLHQIALVGAGALHTIVVRTIDKIAVTDPASLLAAHPELADLQGFDQL